MALTCWGSRVADWFATVCVRKRERGWWWGGGGRRGSRVASTTSDHHQNASKMHDHHHSSSSSRGGCGSSKHHTWSIGWDHDMCACIHAEGRWVMIRDGHHPTYLHTYIPWFTHGLWLWLLCFNQLMLLDDDDEEEEAWGYVWCRASYVSRCIYIYIYIPYIQ